MRVWWIHLGNNCLCGVYHCHQSASVKIFSFFTHAHACAHTVSKALSYLQSTEDQTGFWRRELSNPLPQNLQWAIVHRLQAATVTEKKSISAPPSLSLCLRCRNWWLCVQSRKNKAAQVVHQWQRPVKPELYCLQFTLAEFVPFVFSC